MKKNSTYVHKPGEKYIVIQKDELDKYLNKGYLRGTGVSKEEYKRRAAKGAETVKRLYGVNCSLELPSVKCARFSDETNRKRANSRKNYYLENYGVENNSQLPDYNDKVYDTIISKYGSIENYNKVKTDKTKDTWKITGYDPYKSMIDSMKQKYGVKSWAQLGNRSNHKYCVNGILFDSFPEVAVWEYAKHNNIDIKHGDDVPKFKYTYNGIDHYYFPDFIYDGRLVEIKGSHFFNDDGTMCNPFDHSLDGLYEAKHQCGLENGVEFWVDDDFKFAIDYVYNILRKRRKDYILNEK